MASRGARAMQGVLESALGLPEAHEDHPWGEVVVKVRGKVFVFFGTAEKRADGVFLCLKLPESGPMLTDQEWAKPAGYGLGKSGWVELQIPPAQLPPPDVLRGWVEESYRAVAPKGCVKVLDGEQAPAPRRKKVARKAKKKVARRKVARKTSRKARPSR